VIAALVRDDSEEPRSDTLRLATRSELLEAFDQSSLHEVGCDISVAHHPNCVTVENVAVAPNEEAERVAVARENVPYDLCIGALGRRCHETNIGDCSVHGRDS
jgi:hypothetical protein